MIRLSKLTDYAIVVMAQMARDRSAIQTVPQLADRTGVPAPTVAKLLKLLTPAGLMVSHRAAGGYTLAKPAEDISMAAIIAALEGPIALTACVDGNDGQCGVESLCPMRGGWDKLNKAIRRALEEVTLADMAVVPTFPPLPAVSHQAASRQANASDHINR